MTTGTRPLASDRQKKSLHLREHPDVRASQDCGSRPLDRLPGIKIENSQIAAQSIHSPALAEQML